MQKAVPLGILALPLILIAASTSNVETAQASPGVCGFAFIDANGNGKYDPDESGLQGWEVCLTAADGSVQCRTTDDFGAACFLPLANGSYEICTITPDGWENTTPDCAQVEVGENIAQRFFGNRVDTERTPADVESAETNTGLELSQNVPNPFVGSTEIRFQLTESASIRLSVIDAGGRVVRELANGVESAGTHAMSWDGRDVTGRDVPAGIYFYRLHAGTEVQTRQMILLSR